MVAAALAGSRGGAAPAAPPRPRRCQRGLRWYRGPARVRGAPAALPVPPEPPGRWRLLPAPPRPALPYPAPLWRRHRRAALCYWSAPGTHTAPRALPLVATREGGAPARPLRAPPAAPRGGSAARQALGAGEERAGIPGNSRITGMMGMTGMVGIMAAGERVSARLPGLGVLGPPRGCCWSSE